MANGEQGSEGIGADLRRAREQAGMGLPELEERTKIRKRYLEALEQERWDSLPSPAHARGFLRSVAGELGLDADELVDRLRRQGGAEPPEPPAEGVLRTRRAGPGGPGRSGWAAVAAAALLAGAGVFAGFALLGDDEGDERRDRDRDRRERSGGGPAGDGRPTRPFRLVVTAVDEVEVCLVEGRGRPLIDGQRLAAGTVEGPFDGEEFRLDLLSGGTVRIGHDGREERLRAPDPARYEIVAGGVRELPLRREECP